MIKPDALITVRKLNLCEIQVGQVEQRYLDRLMHYVQLLREHPHEYAGIVHVEPSRTHPGMYTLLDGYHRFAASILAGRPDVLAVVIEEVATGDEHE